MYTCSLVMDKSIRESWLVACFYICRFIMEAICCVANTWWDRLDVVWWGKWTTRLLTSSDLLTCMATVSDFIGTELSNLLRCHSNWLRDFAFPPPFDLCCDLQGWWSEIILHRHMGMHTHTHTQNHMKNLKMDPQWHKMKVTDFKVCPFTHMTGFPRPWKTWK